MKQKIVLTLVLVIALLSSVMLTSAFAKPPEAVNVQILAVNDFHGAVDAALTKPSSTNQATWYYRGGAEYSRFVDAAAAKHHQGLRGRHDRGHPAALGTFPR
jgi:2',3'-cyclic-nucleotide 2'-phosphodiesterase (5'-nucleotidase family)